MIMMIKMKTMGTKGEDRRALTSFLINDAQCQRGESDRVLPTIKSRL